MPESEKPDGILKREIRELVNRRRDVKNLMQKTKPGSELYAQVGCVLVAVLICYNPHSLPPFSTTFARWA